MDINEFKKWVFTEFKINLQAYKEVQLDRRILSLMSRSGFKDFSLYSKELKTNKEERQKFLDFITINVTEFFRNPEIFDLFRKDLKKILDSSKGKVKIWSAACSIGCEPYTIAIMADKFNASNRISIIATDIDLTILAKAKKGEFTENELKNVSKEDLKKYFDEKGNLFVIKDFLKKNITFKKHDLILDRYEKDFDVIICRNVVIYFKPEVKDEIYKNFSESLKSEGILFVGATESIYDYKKYNLEKGSTFIYRKH